jgi:hypothetical protein
MKTVLIHSAFGLWPMLEYELDIAQKELDIGNKVIFLYCNGGQVECPASTPKVGNKFKKRYCQECRSRVKKGVNWLKQGSGQLHLESYDITYDDDIKVADILHQVENSYPNEAAIQSITDVNGVDIFESALSTAMSKLRDSSPKLKNNWPLVKSFIDVSLRAYFSASHHLSKWNPDTVYIYNGRISRYRPMLRLVQSKNIKLFVYEYPGKGGDVSYEGYTVVKNNYSHDLLNYSKQSKAIYDSSIIEDKIKLKIGEKWYLERLYGDSHEFQVTMRERQKKDSLPIDWCHNNFNISFFISSEYEWAGIPEVVKTRPYKDQYDCIVKLSKILPKQSKLYIRVHPNLKNDEKILLDRLSSIKHQNVVLIDPLESVDTYKLAEVSDLIICFGSTVGIEAAFMKKPVIVVGVTTYTEFNATIMVTQHDDLVNTVEAAINGDYSDFPSKSQRYEGACAYAWSLINFQTKTKYVERAAYLGGYMVRNGIKTNISPGIYIKIYNRLLDFPVKVFSSFVDVISDNNKLQRFKKRPIESIKNKFFGEMP